MPIFPEHIHIEGEDALLRHAARADGYRHLLEAVMAVAIACGLLLIAAVAALMLV